MGCKLNPKNFSVVKIRCNQNLSNEEEEKIYNLFKSL